MIFDDVPDKVATQLLRFNPLMHDFNALFHSKDSICILCWINGDKLWFNKMKMTIYW